MMGKPLRVYKTRRKHRLWQMLARDRRRDAKLCINSEKHGPATHGCRCAACDATHRRTR